MSRGSRASSPGRPKIAANSFGLLFSCPVSFRVWGCLLTCSLLEQVDVIAKLVYGRVERAEPGAAAGLHDAALHRVQDRLRELLPVAVGGQPIARRLQPLPHGRYPVV